MTFASFQHGGILSSRSTIHLISNEEGFIVFFYSLIQLNQI